MHQIGAKKPCLIGEVAFLAGRTMKIKESKKRDKYLYLVRELKKKLWNVKVTVIQIVIGALGTITKGWVKRLEEKSEDRWRPSKQKYY